MQNSKLSVIAIITIILIGASGYFFWQNQKLSAELAVFKNTDLAKEAENLRLNLKSVEDTLALEKSYHEDTKNKLATADGKIKTLEITIKQTKPYIGVLKAFDNWQRPSNFHILDRDTSQIDSAISILGDRDVSDLWQEVKANFSSAKQTGDFRDNDVPVLVTSKLVKLLK